MGKVTKVALTVIMAVLLGLAPARITYASSPARVQKPAPTTANIWAESVVDVVTDPKLYRYNEQSLPVRLHNLVRLAPVPPGDGTMEGSNPSKGILFVRVNLIRDGIQEIKFTMPGKDAEGHAVFPAVRRRLERRLRHPWTEGWNLDDPEQPLFSWRFGETKSILRLTMGVAPNMESAVSVVAAMEQGDPEE